MQIFRSLLLPLFFILVLSPAVFFSFRLPFRRLPPLQKVALEEEGFEQQAVAAAAAAATLTAAGTRAAGRAGRGRGPVDGGSSGWVWWWGRGRRVSRERLVEEALELTFRLIMSGDVALDALKVCLCLGVGVGLDVVPSAVTLSRQLGVRGRSGVSYSLSSASGRCVGCEMQLWCPPARLVSMSTDAVSTMKSFLSSK